MTPVCSFSLETKSCGLPVLRDRSPTWKLLKGVVSLTKGSPVGKLRDDRIFFWFLFLHLPCFIGIGASLRQLGYVCKQLTGAKAGTERNYFQGGDPVSTITTFLGLIQHPGSRKIYELLKTFMFAYC